VLTEEQRDAWIWDHGPWLYWSLYNPRLWPLVMRDGIQPSIVTGQKGLHGEMPPRPGHVYFMTDPTPAARLAAGVVNEPQARVDIRNLCLDRLATDEDRVGAHRPLSTHRYEVQQLPRWNELPERPEEMTAAEWMNEHSEIVDQPEWVWHSMTELTVAHRGAVKFELMEVLPLYVLEDWEPAAEGETFSPDPGPPPQDDTADAPSPEA
jgi:hypothetical protein